MTTRASVLLRVTGAMFLCATGAASLCGAAAARELWSDEEAESTLELRSALKASTLAPQDSAAMSLWRLRFTLNARLGSRAGLEMAYEQRTRTTPSGGTGGLDVLPPDVDAPYRITQLDEVLFEEGGVYSHRHELDRAMLALHSERAEVSIGRQAVGWGRGVLFGAVDVFSPFSPLEIDREWRRGIDAVRADLRLTDTYSVDTVCAFGADWDWEKSALLARFRGYSGNFDSELIFGKRAEDAMYAGTFSAAVGDAAVHGELALFDTPEKFYEGGLFSRDDHVAKAVLGTSYMFDVGRGLTVWAEYHFNGFGSDDVATAYSRLDPFGPSFDPGYLARLLRSDMQVLGRHEVALQAGYNLTDAVTMGLVWMANASDGSGVAAASLNWNFSDNVTIVASAYAPYGAGRDALDVPRSEYGGSPSTVFLQIRVYD